MHTIKEKIETTVSNSDLRGDKERRTHESSHSFPHHLKERNVTVLRERRKRDDRRDGKYEN